MRKAYGGFKGSRRLQGGWIGAAIGLAGSIFASSSAKKSADKANKTAQEGIKAADPYAKYREDAALRLQKLQNDPNSIKDSASYKARMQAAERTMAAQGYTGSGNALVEAANAGGSAYEQEFGNLVTLSGAGVAPGGGYSNALQTQQNGSDSYLSSLAGITNNATNLASMFKPKPAPAPATFNQPVNTSRTVPGTGPN